MFPSLTIIDNLLPHERAIEIRDQAIKDGFTDFEYMSGVYQGTGLKCPPDIAIALSQFVGGGGADIKIQAFRNGHEETDLHTNIHADNPIAQWAGVYYLNLPEQCKGGTAFYTLKETGWDMMPTQKMLDDVGKDIDWMRSKWSDESQWNLNTIAGMKFNRMIFYPTVMFHSRYPLKGWGPRDKPEESRLVHVCFFNILP